MRLNIDVDLRYAMGAETDLLLHIEAASDADQTCETSSIAIEQPSHPVAGQDGVGTRRWLRAQDTFHCQYSAVFTLHRAVTPIEALPVSAFQALPAEVVPYLMPSRFCHSEQFDELVAGQFGTRMSGATVAEMAHWVHSNMRYDPWASFLGTTATDSFYALAGVCRDFAHVLITLLRAAGVPARFVSVYGADVRPADFHAVVDVWLDGAWHLIDPTGMTHPGDLVRIGVGRDAADVAFLTSYGPLTLIEQSVRVRAE